MTGRKIPGAPGELCHVLGIMLAIIMSLNLMKLGLGEKCQSAEDEVGAAFAN